MKIYHHNDADGRCSAAIVELFFGSNPSDPREYVEVDYKDEINVEAIGKDELVYIVDFSFKPHVMEEVLKRTSYVVWIDHHKTAFEYQYSETLPGIRDSRDAACELTWKFLFPDEKLPRAVELIGDYDKWALKFKPECFQFYEGLKLEDTSPESTLWPWLFKNPDRVDEISKYGKHCIIYRDNYCGDMRSSNGYSVNFEGHYCYALNVYGFGSKAFGAVMARSDIEACIAYIYDGEQYTVSMYSTKIDVSEICKKHGGGGHKGAAGFTCKELPFKREL